MEMGGIHVKDVNNPSKNYPKAVFIGALITVLIFVLGTFALGVIIPAKDISLTQSLLVGFDNYFRYIHASWLSPVIAVALAFGVLAGVLTWVAGPSKVSLPWARQVICPILPENKQAGCTKEHSVRTRWRCNRIKPSVRGDAFGTEFLPDSFTTDGGALSHHVYADVLRSHRIAL